LSRFTLTRSGLLRSPLAAFVSAVVVLTGLWLLAGPNSVDEISGDATYYLDMWREPRKATAPPFTYRVLTPWMARLTGLGAFWAFAVVSITGLAVAGVLLWAAVLHDRTAGQAWLALGLFVVSPAAVFSLADHYLVDPVAYAFLACVLVLLQRNRLTAAAAVCVAGLLAKEPVLFAGPIVLLLAFKARARAAMAILVFGAPALYLIIHRTDWIAKSNGREFPYFTEANLRSVISDQGGVLRATLIAAVVGFGPLAVAAGLGWRSTAGVLRLWALLLIPTTLAVFIASDWIRMLAYSAVVFVPIAAQRAWSRAGAALTLGATAASSILVQRMSQSWSQVFAGGAIVALYAVVAPQRAFTAPTSWERG
jgi:hypothetical protein